MTAAIRTPSRWNPGRRLHRKDVTTRIWHAAVPEVRPTRDMWKKVFINTFFHMSRGGTHTSRVVRSNQTDVMSA
ncbi:Hypothetical predicted protein [Pelobates cultripes]|uniref:Uncharacterized protein n=1 Tax=Pelobates cultripes TaxID=61616 RepID=A0AAD1SRL2_PELCU|nr:Hypothetical predicted protein [Pelobates cultripes]